jgi:hypothetical protein
LTFLHPVTKGVGASRAMTNHLTDPAAGLHVVICGSNKLNLLVNIGRNVKPKKIG